MTSASKPIIILLAICWFLTGCKKEEPLSPSQILTSKTWQIDEIRYVQLNTNYLYKRGGSGNNVNYDDAIIKFNTDGTGNTRWQGNSFDFDWRFDAATTKVIYTLKSGLVITWDKMTFDPAFITYTETYTLNGTVSQAYAVRTPKN